MGGVSIKRGTIKENVHIGEGGFGMSRNTTFRVVYTTLKLSAVQPIKTMTNRSAGGIRRQRLESLKNGTILLFDVNTDKPFKYRRCYFCAFLFEGKRRPCISVAKLNK